MKPQIKIQLIENKDVLPQNGNNLTVGVHGIKGSFSHESVLRLCDEIGANKNKVEFKYLIEVDKVVEAVNNGEVDRGVFAVANSGSGACVFTVEAMAKYSFKPIAIYGMEVVQCLLTRPNITQVSQIKKIFAHPQAMEQCKKTFEKKYPGIKLIAGQDSDDTALCAKRLAQGAWDDDTATLASNSAAKIYGLNVVKSGMQHDPLNMTTFVLIKKV